VIFELDGKGGDAFDTMLKNNQEQSTSGHVSCRHCGAVLFRKKDSPLQGESGTFCESFALISRKRMIKRESRRNLRSWSWLTYFGI
jgi:catabolite regulation protein CreA